MRPNLPSQTAHRVALRYPRLPEQCGIVVSFWFYISRSSIIPFCTRRVSMSLRSRMHPKTIAISAQLNVGNRWSSKGATERYKGFILARPHSRSVRNRSRPTMLFLSSKAFPIREGRSANVRHPRLPTKSLLTFEPVSQDFSVLKGPDRPILTEGHNCDRCLLRSHDNAKTYP
jgi:hypothetical protein